MSQKENSMANTTMLPEHLEKPKYSWFLTSPIVTVTVDKTTTYFLHLELLCAESKRFANDLKGNFKEAADHIIDVKGEDPELFGFFVEYLYRDRSILSREVQHTQEYVTLARLYAMGERLMAPSFQAYCLWRFTQSLNAGTPLSEESICGLLQLACTEITERVREDPLRSHIFWFGGSKLATLQNSDIFRQILCELPDLGRHLCLWVHRARPAKPSQPTETVCQKFGPESEYNLPRVSGVPPRSED